MLPFFVHTTIGDAMQWKLKSLVFLSYFLCAIGTTQIIPYISYLGFDASQKSYMLSMIAIVTILLQICSGYISDKLKKIKILFLIVYGIYIISNILLFKIVGSDFLLYLGLVGLVGGCYRCSQGLLDSWLVQLTKSNFSNVRAYGALGWGIGSILLAYLIDTYGFDVIVYILMFIGVISFLLGLCIGDSKREKARLSFSDVRIIVNNKKYMLFVCIVFLLYSLGCADMYIVVDKILEIGGNKWIVGMKWGLQSLFEIPILLIGDRLLKRFGVIRLMIFASIMFILRFLLYAWIQIPTYFLYASVLQLVTFPIVVFCSREEFDRLIDEKLKTTAQMFAMSIYMGVSLFIMPILCNALVNMFGYDVSLMLISSFSIITLLLLCLYKKLDMVKQKL